MKKTVKAIKSEMLSKEYEARYILVDQETGEILDDAQGYGYKTRRNAYAAFSYKMRDRSKDQGREEREEYIRKWMREHKSFVRFFDQIAFEIVKGSWAPEDKVDAKLVKWLMQQQKIETDIRPGEFLQVWRKGKY